MILNLLIIKHLPRIKLLFMRYLYTCCFVFFANLLFGQELNCTVTVNGDQVFTQQSTDKQVFVEMQSAISNFLNSRRWTDDIFSSDERIKCNLIITFLKSPKQNIYTGTAKFQVLRPIYGTGQQSVIFSFVDRAFEISFAPEDRQMMFNEQSYSSNLTSILGFYAMVALAMDYDSFSKLGGNPYVQRAFNITNLAGNAGVSGWQQEKDFRSRYWIAENLQNQQLLPLREGFYIYHRLALDNFINDAAAGRKQILDYLTNIRTMQTQKTNAILISTFFDAKSQELFNIFSEAPKEERLKVFDLLSNIDPDKTEIYRPLSR